MQRDDVRRWVPITARCGHPFGRVGSLKQFTSYRSIVFEIYCSHLAVSLNIGWLKPDTKDTRLSRVFLSSLVPRQGVPYCASASSSTCTRLACHDNPGR